MEGLVSTVKEIRDIQGRSMGIAPDDYMLGMYNGLELATAIMEEREPVYKECQQNRATMVSEKEVLDHDS